MDDWYIGLMGVAWALGWWALLCAGRCDALFRQKYNPYRCNCILFSEFGSLAPSFPE